MGFIRYNCNLLPHRGYSSWPARKTGEFQGKLWVKFYGSNQHGSVTKNKNWTGLSETSLKQFVTNKNLSKPKLKEAIHELLIVTKGLKDKVKAEGLFNEVETFLKLVSQGSGDSYLKDGTEALLAVATGSPEMPTVTNVIADEPSKDGGTASSEAANDDSEFEAGNTNSESETATRSPEIPRQGSSQSPSVLKTISSLVKNKQTKATKVDAKNKSKEETKSKDKKARQTLLDDQREVNKKYKEKIIEHTLGFSCKLCTFATGIELKAKTHAVSCGVKRKKSAGKKVIVCQECQETFESNVKLHKHFQKLHQKGTYKCSKCGKTYKKRRSYSLHLKLHDNEFKNRFKCNQCNYKTRDNWLLVRHCRLKHSDKSSETLNAIVGSVEGGGDKATVAITNAFITGEASSVTIDQDIIGECDDSVNEFAESVNEFGERVNECDQSGNELGESGDEISENGNEIDESA